MENNKNLKDEIVKAIKGEFNEHFKAIDRRFNNMEAKMDDGFREQGVLMHVMQDDIETLIEGQEVLHQRIDRLAREMHQA
jgi:hypothetical protein